MTNSNQSNTPENPATLLNSSGSTDSQPASPATTSPNSAELSSDDLDFATLERLTAPDAPAPTADAAEADAAEAGAQAGAAEPVPQLVAPEVGAPEPTPVEPNAPSVTVTADTVIARADNTEPVSVNMIFDDEPRIKFEHGENQASATGISYDFSEQQSAAAESVAPKTAPESPAPESAPDAVVEPSAQLAEPVAPEPEVAAAPAETNPADIAPEQTAAEGRKPPVSVTEEVTPVSFVADTSYSADDISAVLAAPAPSAEPAAVALVEPATEVASEAAAAPELAPEPTPEVAAVAAEPIAPEAGATPDAAALESVVEPVAPAPANPAVVPASANIMGGATVMNAGHTAIMGLENRKVFEHKKADLSGISAEERAAIERINALNARNRGKVRPAAAPAPTPESRPSGLTAEEQATLERINALNARNRAPRPEPAPAPESTTVAATGTTVTGAAGAAGANIMGGATMMDAGHTAIMGLENRRVVPQQVETSTRITGISEEDLAVLQRINAQNAKHRSQWVQAQAKFHAEIAAERAQAQESGNALEVPGYLTPHGHAEEVEAAALHNYEGADEPLEGASTFIYGAGASSLGQNNPERAPETSTVITGERAEEVSSGASLARDRLRQALAADQQDTARAEEYDAQAIAAELEAGIAGPVDDSEDYASPETFAAPEGELMEVRPEDIAGANPSFEAAPSFEASGADYGLSGKLGSALDDEPRLDGGVIAGAEPDDLVPGRAVGLNTDDYAGIVAAVDQVPSRKVASPIVTEDNAPDINIVTQGAGAYQDNGPDLETKVVVQRPAAEDGFPTPTYPESGAGSEQDYPEQNTYQEPVSYPEAAYPAQPAYPEQAAYPSAATFDGASSYGQSDFGASTLYDDANTNAFDGVVAPAPRAPVSPEGSPYITPGAPSERATPQGEVDYVVGPEVSSQDLAAQAGEPNYVVGRNQPEPEPTPQEEDDAPLYVGTYAEKLAREQAMRERAAAAVAVQRSPELDRKAESTLPPRTGAPVQDLAEDVGYEDDLRDAAALAESIKYGAQVDNRVPSGMGDGVLSQLTEPADTVSDEGPRYVVGPTKRRAPVPETDNDDGPRYVVGVDTTNAEVEARLQKERSQLSRDIALPYSYLDDEPIAPEAAAKDEEFEQALMAAARESMAAPQSKAVDMGRKLADEGLRQDRAALEQGEEPEAEPAPAPEPVAEPSPEATALAEMPRTEHVKFSMAVFLFLRQLIASFFTHTTLPVVTPQLALRLGPCYPSSMALPFFVVGLLVGALGGFIKEYTPLQMAGTATCLVFLLLTGLTPYRGIYRIFAFITRRRHDAVMMASSVMVSLLVFISLSNTLVQMCAGVGEFTLAFALAAMLSAATASTLMWNFPQDPMDSCGTMTNKGLIWVLLLCGLVTFGFLHYIVALSILGVGIVMRLIFGYCIAKNQGTAQRPYVSALQLLTLFAILLDLILLKSQNYEFLNFETITWLERHAEQLFGLV